MAGKTLDKNELLPKIAVIVGTRPGIIKFSPVIKVLEERGADFVVIHTGQHYSFNMDRVFFETLRLPMPAHTNDKVRECTLHGEQTAEMICGVERALLAERPSIVIVGGDANTNLAGALATRKLVNIKLAHMEAGLRSHDWRMPEEHNRVIIDRISELLFPPTEACKQNLLTDNCAGRIVITGNTIVDAVERNKVIARESSTILARLGVEPKRFALFTMHREENVESCETVARCLDNLAAIRDDIGNVPVIFPIHPRTIKQIRAFGLQDKLDALDHVRVIDPVDYLDMLVLMDSASIAFTDSGGIQEETCILRTPCVTLRDNTERPETVEVGASRLVGADLGQWKEAIAYFRAMGTCDWANPFGDGRAAERIVDELLAEIRQPA